MPGDYWCGARAARQEGGSGLADPRNSADCLKILTYFVFVIVITITNDFSLSFSLSWSAFLVHNSRSAYFVKHAVISCFMS